MDKRSFRKTTGRKTRLGFYDDQWGEGEKKEE